MEKKSLPVSREIIAHRISRARKTLSDAKLLLRQKDSANSAVNRLYFAVHYAVSALLPVDGLGSRKYAEKRDAFVDHLVFSERISKDSGRTYRELVAAREAADHEDMFSFGTAQAGKWMAPAEQLIKEVETLLKNFGELT